MSTMKPYEIRGEVRLSTSGIRAMRDAAQASGDLATVDMCDEALAGSATARAECDRLFRAAQGAEEAMNKIETLRDAWAAYQKNI